MGLDLTGLVIVVGNYGSGKTEVSVNLAVHRRHTGVDVRLVDLDLVNPYFRSREARKALSRLGIRVVLPPEQYMQADLPIVDAAVAGAIRDPGELTILDVGGDDVGATVLASLGQVLRGAPAQVLQVVNPFRPFTDTVAGAVKIGKEIEAAAKLAITGIIGNGNLIEDTTVDHVLDGYTAARQVADRCELPLTCITAPVHLLAELNTRRFTCPVLPIRRQLVPPWKKAVSLDY